MTRLLREAAFVTVLAVAAPVWAQAPMTAADLNRQELNRLASAPAPAPMARPNGFVADPVGLIVADGIRPPPPRFPGLLTLLGVGVAAGGSFLDTLLVGGPSQY
ncbi:MAG TPA: hypothetical protein VGR70_14340 [Stellaceae bacterium]|nr:hypothetical protein [Stellaceae bacterium]